MRARRMLQRGCALVMAVILLVLSNGVDTFAANQYKGGIVIQNSTPRKVEKGLMPSKGNVKAAVLMVEFPDYAATHTRGYVAEEFFGETESVSSYYRASSYQMLNLGGDVYDWYKTSNPRAYYEDNTREYPREEYLIREVVQAMDAQVDFSQYDSDNDGYVDAVYLVCSGKNTGYKSMWWAYEKTLLNDMIVDGKKIGSFVLLPEDSLDYFSVAHETGHLMGLQDYYDSEQGMFGGTAHYGTDTLMNNSSGDLDVFSKWMLGWITPKNITDNAAITLRPCNEYPDAVVIRPRNASANNTFFMVDYRTATKNNKFAKVGGVTVYRVNATIDSETGQYKYDVSSHAPRLIESVAVNVKEGYAIGTSKMPYSYIAEEVGTDVVYSQTGVVIENVAIQNNVATANVVYSNVVNTETLTAEVEKLFADNRAGYLLSFPMEVTYNQASLYASGDGEEIPLIVDRSDYANSKNMNDYCLYTSQELAPGKTYKVSIPAGTFTAVDGRLSQAIEFTWTSDNYQFKKEYEKTYPGCEECSNTLLYGNNGFVYFANHLGTVYMVTVDDNGQEHVQRLYTISDYSGVLTLYESGVQACRLENGNYVLVVRNGENSIILKVSPDGQCQYLGEKKFRKQMICSSVGDIAILDRLDDYKCLILDADGTLKEVADTSTYSRYLKCTDAYYAKLIDFPGSKIKCVFVDANFKQVQAFATKYDVIGADYRDGNYVLVEYTFTDKEFLYYEAIYNNSGQFVSRRRLFSLKRSSMLHAYTKAYPCKYGYVFYGQTEIATEKEDGEGAFSGRIASPVACVMVTDKNFNKQYTYTIDKDNLKKGDTVWSIIETGDGSLICATDWSDYRMDGPNRENQHTHAYDANNVCTLCGYKLILDNDNSTGGSEQPGPSVNPGEHVHEYDENFVCRICGQRKATASQNSISYQTHVQKVGWQDWKADGVMSGTSGRGLRLEGIRIKLDKQLFSGSVQYRTHVQKIGWQDWRTDGVMSGTSGEAKRLEAIEIKLVGEMAQHYDIYYRVHCQKIGWMGWTKNGGRAGSAGLAYRLEGIEIRLVDKGAAAPGDTTNSFCESGKFFDTSKDAVYSIAYRTHVQSYGWQNYVGDGITSGTSGQAKRLEGIEIKLNNQKYEGSIQYRTHVQKIGWQDWKSDGAMSGTSGQALRLEAIEIRLTGELAQQYDVYYRVHAQSYGWLGWAKNGESSGTAGYAKRLEGIQILLLPKGVAAPASNYIGTISNTNQAFIKSY